MKRLKRTFSEKFGRFGSSNENKELSSPQMTESIEFATDLASSASDSVLQDCYDHEALQWDKNSNTMIMKNDYHDSERKGENYRQKVSTLGSLSQKETLSRLGVADLQKKSRSKSESLLSERKPRRYSSASDPNSPFGKMDSYEFLELLGEGSYATVYRGKFKDSDQVVALKKVSLNSEEGTPFTAIREVSLLKTLKHSNIVALYDVIHTNSALTLVFEYMDTDLSLYMEKIGVSRGINPKNAVLFTFQLLRGLDFCHKKKILHRDLKPQNLLISEKGELKLADFGLARAKSIPTNTYSNEVVTLWYRPPDVLLGSTDYDSALDMWGVGCIFLEMLVGTPVCPGQTDACDQLNKIFELLGTPTPNSWPRLMDLKYYEEYYYNCFIIPKRHVLLSTLIPLLQSLEYGEEFASSLLQYEPSLRLNAQDAMKHPMFGLLPQEVHSLGDNESIFSIKYIKLVPEETASPSNVSE